MKFDVTWYWCGGTEVGKWHAADPGLREEIRRGGRVAHDGLRSIGAPEGPPSKEELDEVLRFDPRPHYRPEEQYPRPSIIDSSDADSYPCDL